MVICGLETVDLALETQDLHLFAIVPLGKILVIDRVSDGYCVFSFGGSF